MLAPQERVELEKGFTKAKILWSVCFAALLVFLVIGHVISGGVLQTTDPESLGFLRGFLYFASVVIIVSAYFLRKYMLSVGPKGSIESLIYQIFFPTSEFFIAASTHPAVGKYTFALVQSAALSETPALCGFIVFLVHDKLSTLYTFIAISAIAMFFYRPKFEELEKLAINMKQA